MPGGIAGSGISSSAWMAPHHCASTSQRPSASAGWYLSRKEPSSSSGAAFFILMKIERLARVSGSFFSPAMASGAKHWYSVTDAPWLVQRIAFAPLR